MSRLLNASPSARSDCLMPALVADILFLLRKAAW
jgi:hypothetical protein